VGDAVQKGGQKGLVDFPLQRERVRGTLPVELEESCELEIDSTPLTRPVTF
jgi:hypothetical protein